MTRRYPGTIERLRSGRYRARVPNGHGRYITVGVVDSDEEAKQLLAAAALVRCDLPSIQTVAEYGEKVIDRWRKAGKRSADSDASRWATLVCARAEWAQEPLDALSRPAVRDWVRGLVGQTTSRGEPISEQSLRHALGLVRRVCAEAVADELLEANPAEDVEAPKSAEARDDHWTALSLAEIDAVLTSPALGHETRCAVALAVYTGLRQGELAALRWEDARDLDGSAPHLVVRRSWDTTTKTRRTRRVDLLPAALPWLRSLPGERAACIWGTEHARGYDWGWAGTTDLGYGGAGGVCWLGARRRAGIVRDVTWHHLRDTCASHLLSGSWGRSWTIAEVGALLGHTTTWVTERYARLLPGALADAAAGTRGRGDSAEPPAWEAKSAGGMRFERMTFGSGGRSATGESAAESATRGRSVGGQILALVARGAPVPDVLLQRLADEVLDAEPVRLALAIRAGDPHALTLAIRLALASAGVGAESEVG